MALREEVVAILRAAGASALLVTHDQQEALSLADVVVVMRAGRVEQIGHARGGLPAPGDALGGRVPRRRRGAHRRRRSDTVECELGVLSIDRAACGPVDVVIRPESVLLDRPQPGATTAQVVSRTFLGHDQVTRVRLPSGHELRSRSAATTAWDVGDEVTVVVVGPVATFAPAADGTST